MPFELRLEWAAIESDDLMPQRTDLNNAGRSAEQEARAQRLAQMDRAYLWHPFTPMAEWLEREPLIVESGRGIYVTDAQGREYFDGNSSLWVNVHGHRRPEIDDAIRKQLDRIAHSTMLGLSNPPAIELAEKLVELAPSGLSRVFYSDSGSEAVEIALKMAFQHWQLRGEPRTHYLTLANGYHGDTLGAVSVGGINTFHALFRPLLFSAHFAPSPGLEPRALPAGDAPLETFVRILEEHAPQIAAVILEPLIQAAGGMIQAPAGFLKGVEAACRRAGVLLIVDEVATGFGRTGRMFACEHEDVHPDLMCVAKGLTGGYLPLAATLATEEVFRPFLSCEQGAVFYHGHSYTGNALGCAAALANLGIFERERVIEGLQPKVQRIHEGLQEFANLDHVLEARQLGMMVGIELVLDRAHRLAYAPEERTGAKVCYRARELGMITRPLGDVVVFMPPLSSTVEEITTMLKILYRSIEEVTGRGPADAAP